MGKIYFLENSCPSVGKALFLGSYQNMLCACSPICRRQRESIFSFFFTFSQAKIQQDFKIYYNGNSLQFFKQEIKNIISLLINELFLQKGQIVFFCKKEKQI